MNVALYCRVSTDEQARTGESILDQRQALEQWARDNGHAIANIYLDEGYSAHRTYKKRPALMRLLTDIETGNIDLIAMTKFDRWTRKAADYYEIQERLDRARVPWTAILEDYETITADGRFKIGVMLSVNQHEAERTSERIKFTFEQKRKRGELVSGNMPRGYIIKDGKPVKDPDTEDAVAAFWETYLNGYGLKAAIFAAESRGLRLATSSGSFMLNNAKAYTGQIQGVSCAPYITAAQADMVLSTRKAKPKASGTVYLFNGLLRCGVCGGAMSAHRNTYKRKHTDGVQVFYNCMKRYRTYERDCTNSVNIYESDIEAILLDRIEAEIGEAADRLQVKIDGIKSRKADRDQTEKQRKRLEGRAERAWDAYLAGAVTLDRYKAEKAQIDAELAKLNASENVTDENAAKRLRNTLPDGWLNIYFALDKSHRRQFWARVVDSIVIQPNREVVVHLRTI